MRSAARMGIRKQPVAGGKLTIVKGAQRTDLAGVSLTVPLPSALAGGELVFVAVLCAEAASSHLAAKIGSDAAHLRAVPIGTLLQNALQFSGHMAAIAAVGAGAAGDAQITVTTDATPSSTVYLGMIALVVSGSLYATPQFSSTSNQVAPGASDNAGGYPLNGLGVAVSIPAGTGGTSTGANVAYTSGGIDATDALLVGNWGLSLAASKTLATFTPSGGGGNRVYDAISSYSHT